MEGTVTWVDGVRFVGTASSGHSVVMDGPESAGGQNAGLRPMELMLLGVGGCSSFDVVQILRKARAQVESCVAELSAQRADAVPAVFESVHLHFKVRGSMRTISSVCQTFAQISPLINSNSLRRETILPPSVTFNVL